jgi:acyl-CoA dehydrogenase
VRERAARFVREELLPFEAETAERGELDRERLAALWERARALGFANLNMPREHGGEDLPMVALVAVEEESGKVTNGLGWLVADRGPRELLELATPEQVERYVAPVLRRETREAWAITEPGAGSDVSAIATAAACEPTASTLDTASDQR